MVSFSLFSEVIQVLFSTSQLLNTLHRVAVYCQYILHGLQAQGEMGENHFSSSRMSCDIGIGCLRGELPHDLIMRQHLPVR